MRETEVKVLEVDRKELEDKLDELGAKKLREMRLVVDWYRPEGHEEGDTSWYLRIRRRSGEKAEVTWKGESTVLGASRTHKEVNFETDEPEKFEMLFTGIGLVQYAHQEKDRIQWQLKDWDIVHDTYPGIPPYAEIEGKDEAHIQEALDLFGLKDHTTSPEGERKLIHEQYGVDWYDMRF